MEEARRRKEWRKEEEPGGTNEVREEGRDEGGEDGGKGEALLGEGGWGC